ncbi:CHRD domain-containing protein [Kozakia baliensis]|uniref:CHRD domain-containing protein n=1 Tax=Kozakia baliensis TaxID=153496 RepID=UPI0004983F8A|nr:CHRD domain-containing protein [Kozakia baliensis]
MLSRLALPALALTLTAASPAYAEIVKLHGHFITEHNATSHPLGEVNAKLDTKKNTLSYHFKYSHLSGPVNAIHLHGPASVTEDAGVIAPVNGPYTGQSRGTLQLTPEQVKDVQDGKTYINLHTARYAEGEARAQLEH